MPRAFNRLSPPRLPFIICSLPVCSSSSCRCAVHHRLNPASCVNKISNARWPRQIYDHVKSISASYVKRHRWKVIHDPTSSSMIIHVLWSMIHNPHPLSAIYDLWSGLRYTVSAITGMRTTALFIYIDWYEKHFLHTNSSANVNLTVTAIQLKVQSCIRSRHSTWSKLRTDCPDDDSRQGSIYI